MAIACNKSKRDNLADEYSWSTQGTDTVTGTQGVDVKDMDGNKHNGRKYNHGAKIMEEES